MSTDDFGTSLRRANLQGRAASVSKDADDDTTDVTEMSRAALVDRYDDLVDDIAQTIHANQGADVDFDDLRAYGFEGLLQARDRYRHDKGVAFSTFAYYRIRGAILDALRSDSWSARNHAYSVEDRIALNDHLADHHEANGHLPRAKSLQDSIARIDQMVGDSITVLLMRHFDVQDLQATDDHPQHDDLQKRRRLQRIRRALDELTDNEREVLTRYQLHEESMTDIADDMDYSRGWISRINARAIDKIRQEVMT